MKKRLTSQTDDASSAITYGANWLAMTGATRDPWLDGTYHVCQPNSGTGTGCELSISFTGTSLTVVANALTGRGRLYCSVDGATPWGWFSGSQTGVQGQQMGVSVCKVSGLTSGKHTFTYGQTFADATSFDPIGSNAITIDYFTVDTSNTGSSMTWSSDLPAMAPPSNLADTTTQPVLAVVPVTTPTTQNTPTTVDTPTTATTPAVVSTPAAVSIPGSADTQDATSPSAATPASQQGTATAPNVVSSASAVTGASTAPATASIPSSLSSLMTLSGGDLSAFLSTANPSLVSQLESASIASKSDSLLLQIPISTASPTAPAEASGAVYTTATNFGTSGANSSYGAGGGYGGTLNSPPEDSGSSHSAIIGGVVGGVIGVILLSLALYFYKKRNQRGRRNYRLSIASGAPSETTSEKLVPWDNNSGRDSESIHSDTPVLHHTRLQSALSDYSMPIFSPFDDSHQRPMSQGTHLSFPATVSSAATPRTMGAKSNISKKSGLSHLIAELVELTKNSFPMPPPRAMSGAALEVPNSRPTSYSTSTHSSTI